MRARAGISALVTLALGMAGAALGPMAAASASSALPGPQGGHRLPLAVGKAWQPPAARQPAAPDGGVLPSLSAGRGGGAADKAIAAAGAVARRTGRPALARALTTATTQTWVRPGGGIVVKERVLPVRVRRGRGWVRVDTRLIRQADGTWSPAAVPFDHVSFSSGGTGPMAALAAAGQNLRLWWPGALPAPVVRGSSATYRNVLPGVDLVVTAFSYKSGGLTEVLVVRSAAAARNPRLGGLALRVATSGGRLVRTRGGGLSVPLPRGEGEFFSPAPVMWDSSAGSAASARAVGAVLAPTGYAATSSAAAPGGGARLASVGVQVAAAGRVLRLLPDQRLLASPSTRFPVFIDPSFQWFPKTGSEQNNDALQSACPSPHYNSYSRLPIGYNNYQTDQCSFNSSDRALYQISIPSAVTASDANLNSASAQMTEVYSSSCSADPSVTVSWIGAFGKNTGYPGPNKTGNNVDAVHNFGPDSSNSCNNYNDPTNKTTKSQGFDIMGDMNSIGSASNISLRVYEPGDTNEADHKQLSTNPTIQFTYNDTPNVPSALKQASSSSGTGSTACDTDSTDPNKPIIGKTDSTNGPYVLGTFKDPDTDTVEGTIKYWNNATPSTTYTIHTSSLSLSGTGSAQIPASFTSGMKNGTVVGWQAEASDGSSSSSLKYTSKWSSKCYFAVYPTDPDPPTVTAGFDQTKTWAVGTPLSFTISQSSTAASEFVWGLDTTPPTTGTIPSGQICDSTSTTCKLSSGKATLTINATAPGPHILWVYEKDAAGNDSGFATGALPGNVETYDVAADTPVAYTSGSSLSVNFAAALGAGKSYDETMISNSSSTSCGATTGDGTGTDFSASELTAAGWKSGQNVTVDGANFALPAYGSCQHDNVLAANQTIGTGPSGAQGNSVVFLAASTYGFAYVPGQMTGSADSVTPDATAPAIMGGVRVTGTGCTGSVQTDVTLQGMCLPASGTINYVPATGCPASTSYDLTVPDWFAGPTDSAALTMSHIIRTSGVSSQNVKLYAFSVPVDAGCQIASVTLPDVGDATNATLSGSVTTWLPGLHIFGVSVRNTTTASPEVSGATTGTPSQQGWTGAFEAPVENAYAPPAGVTWGNQTFRIWAGPNISAAQGAQIRVRLSFPGFLSADGTGPLQIGAASIAQGFYGSMPAQTPVPLTFGGSTSATIPEGGDVYSDPLTLPASFGTNPVTAGKSLLVSLWIKNSSLPVLPSNSFASGSGAYYAASGTGDQTEDTSGTPFSGTGSGWISSVPVLTGIDVTTPAATVQGTASPSAPTVVVAGNTIVDYWNAKTPPDTLNVPSQRLAGQLSSQGLATGFGVTDGAIESNQVTASNAGPAGGPSLIARIDRDVLAEPDVGTVVIAQGLQDLLAGGGSVTSGPDLSNALIVLETQLNAYGINVIVGNLTPCAGFADGSTTCTTGTGATVDAARQYVNSIQQGVAAPNCWADFDGAVSDGASPEALSTSPTNYDGGDHANLSFAGHAALAQAVSSSGGFCTLMPSLSPLPAVP